MTDATKPATPEDFAAFYHRGDGPDHAHETIQTTADHFRVPLSTARLRIIAGGGILRPAGYHGQRNPKQKDKCENHTDEDAVGRYRGGPFLCKACRNDAYNRDRAAAWKAAKVEAAAKADELAITDPVTRRAFILSYAAGRLKST